MTELTKQLEQALTVKTEWTAWWLVSGGQLHAYWKRRKYSAILDSAKLLPRAAWDFQQDEINRIAPLHTALLKCVEALESCESRVAHIENWHRDNVTPDNFADCQDVGVTPERYLRDTKLSARASLADLRKALETISR